MKELHSKRIIGGQKFLLAEHLEDYVSAQVAAAEYRADRCKANQYRGWLCRVEVCEEDMLYYIWVGGKRQKKVKLLPMERPIHRHKGKHVPPLRVLRNAS